MAGTADAVVKGQKVHTYLARSVIGPPMALLMDQIWSQTVTTTSFSDFMVLTRRFQGDWRRRRSRMVKKSIYFFPHTSPSFLLRVQVFSASVSSLFSYIFQFKTCQDIPSTSALSILHEVMLGDTRNLKPFDARSCIAENLKWIWANRIPTDLYLKKSAYNVVEHRWMQEVIVIFDIWEILDMWYDVIIHTIEDIIKNVAVPSLFVFSFFSCILASVPGRICIFS